MQSTRAPLLPIHPAILDRFMAKVKLADDGCWEWISAVNTSGYGFFKIHDVNHSAHRLSYRIFVGAIGMGLQIDHLCRNRLCVNPQHLEAVTPRENLMRAAGTHAARNAAKTHCLRGHRLPAEANSSNGRRVCHECDTIRRRKRKCK